MNRALLRLALSFTLLLIPALAEEVKVLLDVPAPYAENVFFFPGGRYLLLVSRDPHDYNSVRFIVYDIEAKRWIPVKEKVDKRDGLGGGPAVCIDTQCLFLVSAAGRYLEPPGVEPECRLISRLLEEQIGWSGWGHAAFPVEHHVAASGRYVLYRVRSFPEDPDSTGVAADVAILRVPNDEDVWFDVIDNSLSTNPLDTFPVLWRSAHARPVTTASWLHPLLGHRDRLVLITTDRDDAWNKATHHLVVLEVVHQQVPASGTNGAPPQRAAPWNTGPLDFSQASKVRAFYCRIQRLTPSPGRPDKDGLRAKAVGNWNSAKRLFVWARVHASSFPVSIERLRVLHCGERLRL